MRQFVSWILLLSLVGLQADKNIGTKVVRRFTSGSHTSEFTTYMMGDRWRSESKNSAQHRNSTSGMLEYADPPNNVTISRCDLGQRFELNTNTQEYTSKEYPLKRLAPEEIEKGRVKEPDWDMSSLPVVRVEVTTVDTGERKELFGHAARHVVTTIKQTPFSDSALMKAGVWVTDGWYIDFDQRVSCAPKPHEEIRTHGFVWGKGSEPVQRTEYVEIGHREKGFPIKEVETSLSAIFPAGTPGNSSGAISESEVTEFVEGPLDPALFEVPPGYKLVKYLGWSFAE